MPIKKIPKQKMGQQPNKYHISDEGKIYHINEGGSYTSVGNIEDIENKSSSTSINKIPPIPTPKVNTSDTAEVGWWKRNYNFLWVTTLVIFVGWFISCLSCAWPEYPYYDDGRIRYYTQDNTGYILAVNSVILLCYSLSWFLIKKDKTVLKLAQILLVGFASWLACLMFWWCEQEFSFILVCLATIPVTMWIITLCLSIFRHK